MGGGKEEVAVAEVTVGTRSAASSVDDSAMAFSEWRVGTMPEADTDESEAAVDGGGRRQV